MPFDGTGRFLRTDGVRSGPRVWREAAEALVRINAPDEDAHDNDIARGLESCLTRSGETAASADQPMAGHRHLQVGQALRGDEYATLAQVHSLAPVWVPASGVGGDGNDIELTVDAARSGYRAGFGYVFPASAGNTGAVTISEGSHGVISALREDASPFAGGEIISGQIIVAIYTGTRFLTNVGWRIWSGTQSQYDTLASTPSGVIYLILPS